MLLTDKEILDLIKETAKIQHEHRDVLYGDVWLVKFIAKAQLKKVVEEWKKKGHGYHKQGGQYQTFGIPMECWQSLLEEVK
jgi:hypothetical protein